MSYYGAPLSWFENNDRKLVYGSFFTEKQYDDKELVAILNEDASRLFFGEKNPIGEKVTLGGKIFAVVGVLKNNYENGGNYKNYEAWIPFSTYVERFTTNVDISSLTIYLSPMADNAVWQKRISYALMKYFNLSNVSEMNLTVDSFSKYVDEAKDQQKMMNYLLLVIGSISLLV
jgi:hypothetical protein